MLISINYVVLKLLYKHENSHWPISILVFLIAVVFIYAIFGTYNGLVSFNRHRVYDNLRCNGNSITVEQFERDCSRLWEIDDPAHGSARRACINELENKRGTGKVSDSFSLSRCRKWRVFPPQYF